MMSDDFAHKKMLRNLVRKRYSWSDAERVDLYSYFTVRLVVDVVPVIRAIACRIPERRASVQLSVEI